LSPRPAEQLPHAAGEALLRRQRHRRVAFARGTISPAIFDFTSMRRNFPSSVAFGGW
jgi:hypothetical protein